MSIADLPHLVRSHKYGGALMTQEQFRALEAIPRETAELVTLTGRCRTRAALMLANRIRVRCKIHCVKAIPADVAVETLTLIRELRAETERRVAEGKPVDMPFVDSTIGGLEPWTASVKRKIRRPLPERPDWRALQAELDARVKQRVVPIAVARAKAAPPQARDQDIPLDQLAAQISQDMAALMGRVAMLNYRVSQSERSQEAAA